MNAKTIVVPTDFSECSEEALEYAAALARESGGKLFIVHADELFVPFGGDELYADLLQENFHELKAKLNEAKPSDHNVRYQHEMLRGSNSPAERIVDYARAQKADLIVIGTHGRTGLKRLLLGSVAEAVVRHATCPVLLVKQGSTKPVAA